MVFLNIFPYKKAGRANFRHNVTFKNIVLTNNLQHHPLSFFVLFASSMSDETLDMTNTGSKHAPINLLHFHVNQNSNNQQILSIPSMLLCFVANDINDDDNSHPSTRSIMQQICVVRLATAILQQKQNADSIDESSGSQANVKGGIHPI